MGNSGSKKKLNEQLAEEYESIGLPKVSSSDISNDLEREIYIAINMIRYDPKRMAKLMKPLKNMAFLSIEAKRSVDKVKKMLMKMDSCAPLAMYPDGNKACQQVNNQFFSKSIFG